MVDSIKDRILDTIPRTFPAALMFLASVRRSWPEERTGLLVWAMEAVHNGFRQIVSQDTPDLSAVRDIKRCRRFVADNLPDEVETRQMVMLLFHVENTVKLFRGEISEEDYLAMDCAYLKVVDNICQPDC